MPADRNSPLHFPWPHILWYLWHITPLQEQHVYPHRRLQQGKLPSQRQQFYNQPFLSSWRESVSEIAFSWQREVSDSEKSWRIGGHCCCNIAPPVPLEAALFKAKQRHITHLTNNWIINPHSWPNSGCSNHSLRKSSFISLNQLKFGEVQWFGQDHTAGSI